MALTYLRSRDSGATPLALGPCGCPPPAWGRDQRRRRTAGRADTAAGQGAVHHGAGPPPADAAAGLRWRGPAGPAHSPSQTKAWKVACSVTVALTVDCDRN